MISFVHRGDFEKALNYLARCLKLPTIEENVFDKYGKIAIERLREMTPHYTGLASSSWYYKVEEGLHGATITFHNTDIEGGYNVAILVQYGHGVKGGGYVQGVDFINPALQPIFQEIANELWEEVTKT